MVKSRRIERTQTRRTNAQKVKDLRVTNPEESIAVTKRVRRQVYEGARMGLTWDELGVILDLPVNFLRKECRPDFVRGSYDASLAVCNSLYRMAVGSKKTKPNVTAAIFWLKARARWNDGSNASADPLANIDPDKPKHSGQSAAVLMLPVNGRESNIPKTEVINEATLQALEEQAKVTQKEDLPEDIKDAEEVVVIEGLEDQPNSGTSDHSGSSGIPNPIINEDSPLRMGED